MARLTGAVAVDRGAQSRGWRGVLGTGPTDPKVLRASEAPTSWVSQAEKEPEADMLLVLTFVVPLNGLPEDAGHEQTIVNVIDERSENAAPFIFDPLAHSVCSGFETSVSAVAIHRTDEGIVFSGIGYDDDGESGEAAV